MKEIRILGRITGQLRSMFAFSTHHSLLPTSHSPLPTPHSPLPTPHSPLPTHHFPLPTSHVLRPTFYALCPTLPNRALVGALTIGLMIANQAQAASGTWDGGAESGSGSWSTPANWNPDGNPANGATLIFGNSGTCGTTLDTGTFTSVGGLTFTSSTAAYTISQGTGGTLTLSGGIQQLGSVGVIMSNGMTLSGGNTMNVSSSSGTIILAGIIYGAGSLTKSGNGLLTLSGVNAYSGGTTLNGGVLSVNTLAIGGLASGIGNSGSAAANLTTSAGSTLQYTGTSMAIDRHFNLASGILTFDVTSSSANLTFSDINGSTYGTATGIALAKAGAGTLTLNTSVANTSSLNFITLSSGVLTGTKPFNLVRSAQALTISGNSTLSLGTLTFTGAGGTISATGSSGDANTISSPIVLANTGLGAGVAAGVRLTMTGTISGAQAFTKTDFGTLTLTGSSSFSGGATITAGQLNVNRANALGSGTVTVNSGATMTYTFLNGTLGNIVKGSGTWNLLPASATYFTGSATATLSAFTGAMNIGVGARYTAATSAQLPGNSATINVTGGGQLYLGAGAVTSSSATLTINGRGWSGDSPTYVDGLGLGALRLDGGGTYTGTIIVGSGTSRILNFSGAPTTTGTISLGGGTLELYAQGGNQSINGTITGSGGQIVKLGTFTTSLGAANTYTGPTTIGAGTLSIAADSGLGAAPGVATPSQLTLDGGVLEITANDTTISANRGLFVDAGGGTISTPAANQTTTYRAIITGTGPLTINGSGDVNMQAANTSYSGGWTINGVRMMGGSSSAMFGTGSVTIVGSGGTGAELLATGGTWTNNFAISGFGGNSRDSTQRGALRLDGATVSGTITLQADAAIDSNTGGGTVSGKITGGHALTINKSCVGTVTLSGSNDYTGLTTISGGKLVLSGGVNRIKSGNDLTIAVGTATFDLNGQIQVLDALNGLGTINLGAGALTVGAFSASCAYSGIITGTGSLTKTGTGTLTFGGPNTYTGSTIVSGGKLLITSSGSIDDSSTTTVNSGGSLVIANSAWTLGNAMILNGGTVSSYQDNQGTVLGGGSSTITGGNVRYTFTSSGSLTLPATMNGASVLLVGGGGGGGNGWTVYPWRPGGGGGGGQVLNLTSQSLTAGSHNVTVGGGGGAEAGGGDTSVVGLASAANGGNGASNQNGATSGNGGYAGGLGHVDGTWSDYAAGGGGGDSENGAGGVYRAGGAGGSGTTGAITGTRYGGGGGGGANDSGVVGGAVDGGGAGSKSGTGGAGVVNRGGGGGGGYGINGTGGTGGSGIVVIQYPYDAAGCGGVGTFTGTFDVQSTSTLNAYGDGGLLRMSGTMTGNGGITIASSDSAGGVVLYNTTAKAYNGDTTISSGATLKVGMSSVLPYSGATGDLYDNGTLDLAGFTVTSLNGLYGNGVVYNSHATSASTLTVGYRNSDGSFSGTITDNATLSLNKIGTGTLTLSGANTYSGVTAIQNGAIVISGGNDRLPTTGTVTLGGTGTSGKLIIGDATAARGQTLAWLNTAGSEGSVVGGNGSVSTIYLNIVSGNDTFSGDFGGADATSKMLQVIKNGAGTLTLTGSASITANMQVGTSGNGGFLVVNSGTNAIDVAGGYFVMGNNGSGSIIVNSGTLHSTSYISPGWSGTSSVGAFTQNGGGVTGNPAMLLARNASDGIYNMTAGQATLGAIRLNNACNATVGGGVGTLTISGGSMTATTLYNDGTGGSSVTTTFITIQNAGSLTITGAISIGSQDNTAVTINLDGGALEAGSIAGTTGTGTGRSSTFRFNGGTLRAGNNTATFMQGLTSATIMNNSTIDTDVYNVTIDQDLLLGTAGKGITKNGSGGLTLTGANTYTGGTTINAGTLTIGGAGQLNGGSYTGAIGLTVGTSTFQYNSSLSQTLSGGISGLGAVIKAGVGGLTLTGTNTYTGNTTITGGTLTIGGAGQLNGGSYTGAIGLTAGTSTFQYSSSLSQTLSGVIRGPGAVIKAGAGKLTLGGANTYSGATWNNGGTLVMDGPQALGTISAGGNTGSLTLNSATATFELSSSGTIGALTGVAGGVITTDNSGAFTLTSSGTGTANTTFAGVMKDGGSSGMLSFIKTGTGTLTLSGLNTYSGSTTVADGTLLVSGSIGGSNLTTVETGARLGGTGTVGGAVAVETGGALMPGTDGAGALHVGGNLTVARDGALDWDSTDDQVAVGGLLTLPASLVLNLGGIGTSGMDGKVLFTYTTYSGASSIPLTLPGMAGIFSAENDVANSRIVFKKGSGTIMIVR